MALVQNANSYWDRKKNESINKEVNIEKRLSSRVNKRMVFVHRHVSRRDSQKLSSSQKLITQGKVREGRRSRERSAKQMDKSA